MIKNPEEYRWIGIWIKNRRLKKGWSQEGLCRGICAVSYLSKIEQGKTVPGEDILDALALRLDESWDDSPESRKICGGLIETGYSLVFYGCGDAELNAFARAMEKEKPRFDSGVYWLDMALLNLWCEDIGAYVGAEKAVSLAPYETVMSWRQHALYLMLTRRYEDALRLYPSAATRFWAGEDAYISGRYTKAVELLSDSYRLAAEDGAVWMMLSCRMFIGNCYCNLHDYTQMEFHYRAASRLASALGSAESETIRYNRASACLELGRIEEAYEYFSSLKEPSQMALHKLAICCEKLGKKEEALSALDAAAALKSTLPDGLAKMMCQLVRLRLSEENYLESAEYGSLLLKTFERIFREMPRGYAEFHLPWMLEWYTAKRMYKEAVRLLTDFPGYSER